MFFSSAIGLQHSFKSLNWLATIPPILFILIFKVYIRRTFQPKFRYYIPSEEELREAQVHSQRNDNARNRLEKRFGHPALHSELFTPMVHANMTSLLSQVYSGKLKTESTRVQDMGGQKMEATVVADGIKIAGIQEVSLYPFVLRTMSLTLRSRPTLRTILHYTGATAATTGKHVRSLRRIC